MVTTLHLFALQVLLLLLAPGVPYTCRWSFPGGSPPTSSACSPPPVRYPSVGIKPVTLTVCAAAPHGPCSTTTQHLTVLDPRPLVADVTVDPPESYVGDVVHLSASASGKPPFRWLWNLPGPVTATVNPAVLATARLSPGVLAVRARVSNSYGTSTRTFYLRLLDPRPALNGLSLSTLTPAIGTVLRATPGVTGRPPLTFRWTLDGRLLGTDRTLSWRVADVAPGPHTLALRVTNASGSASLSRTVTVQQPVILDFRPFCPNLLCLFAVDTPVTFDLVLAPSAHPTRFEYDWSGNGPFAESSSTPVPLHVYTEPGNYRPRVKVTTAAGTEVHLASQFLLVTRGGV